jgi:excisionase family DNA binding protein
METSSLHEKIDLLLVEMRTVKQLLQDHENNNKAIKPLTVSEAAEFTGLSPSTIYKLVQYQKLPAIQRKRRGRLLFQKESLFEFLNTKQ